MLQKADAFTCGSQPHKHAPQLGAGKATRISSAVKEIAASEIFTSAAEIVKKVCVLGFYSPLFTEPEMNNCFSIIT